jgi:hypothetical protein
MKKLYEDVITLQETFDEISITLKPNFEDINHIQNIISYCANILMHSQTQLTLKLDDVDIVYKTDTVVDDHFLDHQLMLQLATIYAETAFNESVDVVWTPKQQTEIRATRKNDMLIYVVGDNYANMHIVCGWLKSGDIYKVEKSVTPYALHVLSNTIPEGKFNITNLCLAKCKLNCWYEEGYVVLNNRKVIGKRKLEIKKEGLVKSGLDDKIKPLFKLNL